MKQLVMDIVQSFEKGELPEEAALTAMEQILGRPVDASWLRNYWRSESLEDSIDRLCAAPIQNWASLTETESVSLIAEYLETESPGRQESIQTALERRFRKPGGTLSDLIFQRDLCDPVTILNELKIDTTIYL